MVAVEVEVRALTKAVHSGMWGGPVPDPVMGLSKVLATLVDENGRLAIPHVLDGLKPISPHEEKELAKIPFNEAEFRAASGMLPGVKLLKQGPSPIAQLWKFPSLTITAIQASSRKQAGNIINDMAWAKISIRLAPEMDPDTVLTQLKAHLRDHTPWGLELSIHDHGGNPAWSIEAKGPAYEAAERAMEKGYGVPPLKIGCGGSIPFVRPFADALGGVPALLIGVEDPYTNAHGENESLLVSDLKKACISQIHLFAELAKVFKK
jgi:acetylornithine deacetylase/succinyl-diaminopimelate desuccinylase-like protein